MMEDEFTVERIDVTTVHDIPEELRGKMRSDQLPEHLRRYNEVGTLIYWYNSEREVQHCPRCGKPLPLYI